MQKESSLNPEKRRISTESADLALSCAQSTELIKVILGCLMREKGIVRLFFIETVQLVKLSFRMVFAEKKAYVLMTEFKKLIRIIFEAIFIERRIITGCCLGLAAPLLLRYALLERMKPASHQDALSTIT